MSASAPTAPAGPAPPPKPRPQMGTRWPIRVPRSSLTDVAVAMALSIVAGIGFSTSFGGWGFILPVVVGAGVGAAVGAGAGSYRLPAVVVAALAAVLFFAIGPVVTVRWATLGGLPTPAAFAQMADGAINGWARLLTIVPPAGREGNLLAVPFLTAYLSGLLGAYAARRTRRVALPVVPSGIAFFVAVLWGTSVPAALLPQGCGFAGLSVAWMAARWERRGANEQAVRNLRSRFWGPALLVAALIVGVAVAANLPFVADQRFVLRDVTDPPLDPAQFASPLSRYPWFASAERADKVMFRVESSSRLPEGIRIRLASMDFYDGTTYTVTASGRTGSGVFVKTSSDLPLAAAGSRADVEIQVEDLSGVWLPVLGNPAAIQFLGDPEAARDRHDALRFNAETRALILPPGVQRGDRYRLETVLTPPPQPAQAAALPLDESIIQPGTPPGTPPWVAGLARDIVDSSGAQSPFERATAITEALRSSGFASPDLPATHSLYRLSLFLDRYRQDRSAGLSGTAEQYAATLALLLRSIDIPARVVVGFEPPSGETTFDIVGSDIRAWVEVPFETIGWVAFDPVPDKAEQPVPPPQQTQEVVDSLPPEPPPPAPPLAPVPLPADEEVDRAQEDEEDESEDDTGAAPVLRVLRLVAVVGAGTAGSTLLGVGLMALLVGGVKGGRALRRRRGPAHRSVAGAWDELVDRARDLGRTVPSDATRSEAALLIGVPAASEAATLADAALFGDGANRRDAETAWRLTSAATAQLMQVQSPLRRLAARLNTASLLHRRRSPRKH